MTPPRGFIHLSSVPKSAIHLSERAKISIWKVKRCGQELSLACEPYSNREMKQVMKDGSWSSACWAHHEDLLYIIDKEGNLIKCDPMKENLYYMACGPRLRRHLVNADRAETAIKSHSIGAVIFLKNVIVLVHLVDNVTAECVSEHHEEVQFLEGPIQFTNDSYVAWTKSGNLLQVKATGSILTIFSP